jgi:formylglycine-generating enzyme required for sulfatase activity
MPESIPDLILDVTLAHGRKMLKFVATAREPQFDLYYRAFESGPFDSDLQEHFRQLFRDIEQMPDGCSEDWLAGRGARLFKEIVPVELQRRLWALRGSVRTIQIVSNEGAIPWELLRLRDPDGSKSLGPFLVEAFSITRWLPGFYPVTHLPLRRIALVVPRDSGLPRCSEEGEKVKALRGAHREVVEIPAVYREIKSALASGLYDGWHFAGHGLGHRESAHRWSVLLEDGEELSPEVLVNFPRESGHGPLVFLNACSSGRGAASLTGIAGLASAFLNMGAAAFLGSYWKLRDEQACCFAGEFYKHLFSGTEIGEAARRARLALRDRFGGNDWLAYTLFAHPLASCSAFPDAKKEETRRGGETKRSPAASVSVAAGEQAQTSLIEVVELQNPEPEEPVGPSPGEERVHEKDGTIVVYVPGGEVVLGIKGLHPWSEPIHRICLSPFWIGKFPITNEQYSRFLEENPASPEPAFWKDPSFNQPKHPVVGVSWNEARAYCVWAGLELSSEAQWEAAARGTDQRPYPWGKELPTPRHANFGGKRTTPVGACPAGIGPYGTLDQTGNVWEWCIDPWVPNAYQQREHGQLDPIAKGERAVRVLRGGSWMSPAQDLHAAYRDRSTAKLRFNTQGFRCVWRPA